MSPEPRDRVRPANVPGRVAREIIGPSTVQDARGNDVPPFDSRVRLWREPPGLEFPQEEFRRVNARLRRAARARTTESPQWSINAGIIGGVLVALAALALRASAPQVVGAVIAWIFFWAFGIGTWVTALQKRWKSQGWSEATPTRTEHAWNEGLRPYLSALSSLMVPAVVVLVVSVVPQSSLPARRGLIYAGSAVLAAMAIFRLVTIERRRARTFRLGATGAQLVEAMLAERRCPACAYPLRSLEAESDGCVVCPECGAAWRLESSALPHVPHPDPRQASGSASADLTP